VEWLGRHRHALAVFCLSVYVCWTRVRGWHRFLVDGQVLFSGNDAWYHYRQVGYTVRHFPRTMPFDPWTAYPTGVSVGQFGTIYDQAVALAALVLGAGSPDETTVGLVLLFAPAVLGTLTVVPTYLLGRHAAGRTAGVAAVAVLALTPGGFLQRTTVGFADRTDGNTTIETYVTDPQEAPVPHRATIYRPTQRTMTVDGERVRPPTTRWMLALEERCPTYVVLNAHESLQYLAPDDYSRRAALLANPERERYVRDLLEEDTYPYEVAARFGPQPRYLRSERRHPVWRAVVNAGVFPRSVQYGDGQDLGTDQYTVILERTGACDPAETSPLR
jgi:hypothetical protein